MLILTAIAAACTVMGCTPFAGINPTGAVAPASARGFRLKGVVSLNDAPVPNAHMRAFDLATGKELVLVPYSEQGMPRPAVASRTLADGQGRFDYELPVITTDQVIKVVAEWDGRALVGLVDGTGRTVGGAPESAKHRLLQAEATRLLQLTINLKLTAATTSAAKSFEGVLKTSFQLRGNSAANALGAAMKAASEAIADLERSLNQKSAVQDQIALALDDRGEFDPTAKFQTLLDGVGQVDPLLGRVESLLKQFSEIQKQEAPPKNQNLDAITQEDFPLGRIKITLDGSFSFTDESGKTVSGTFGSGQFVPNDQPSSTPTSTPTAGPTATPVPSPTETPFSGGGRRSEPTPTPLTTLTASGPVTVVAGNLADQNPSATLTCEFSDPSINAGATRPCTQLLP
ncbi:MAG: hypothetical protein VKP62_15805 [Candidatus Sericytochromatia bacterium]|nr:hypothetical protein [Candidatus Sericytochromatia bacterium]